MQNEMGFDDFLYIVKVSDESGEYEYEYGNLKAALEHQRQEQEAVIVKYKDGKYYPLSI